MARTITIQAGRPVLPVGLAWTAGEETRSVGLDEPLQECLSIDVVGDCLVSVRKTPNERSVAEKFPAPTLTMLGSYQAAIWKASQALLAADKGTSGSLVESVKAMTAALAEAVPGPVRDRIAAAEGLATIEVTLAEQSLERYPWELIGSPGVLGSDEVAVWRTVMSEPLPKPKPWGDCVLLTGSEAMLAKGTYVRQELGMIIRGLADYHNVTVQPEPELVISALRNLLDRYKPAVFHFAAHGTREDLRLQNATGPTLEELSISPRTLGADLKSSRVQVALLNCCDSATPPSSGGRPAAYQIADQAGAAVVGMAGIILPYAAAVFGQAFHTALASGRSAVEAYFQGVQAIRGHSSYGMMWSLPVMYSRTSNVRPFPVTDEARLRLSFQEVERHLAFLDRELADLANMSDCEPSQWAERTATPKVRIEGITSYLPALAAARPSAEADQRLQQQKLQRTCQDLRAFLRASAETLSQLSAPGSHARQPRPNRGELRLRRAELQRHLMNLQLLFENAA